MGLSYQAVIAASAAEIWQIVGRIGGKNGYCYANALWRLRGLIDRMVGGRGMEAGCPRTSELQAGGEEPWVLVQIEDTGTGICTGDMADIWKMFKPTADGLGFGLWWVRTFIEQQGGTIDCCSEPGIGTTFTVRLPGRCESGPSKDHKEEECEARF